MPPRQQQPVLRPVSKRKQRAAFLRRVSRVEITAGTKKDFLIVVPLETGSSTTPETPGSLLVVNRTADAIASLQAALSRVCCSNISSCQTCASFRNLPPLPVHTSDRVILSGRRIHAIFEARLARIVHASAALDANATTRETSCVVKIQSIVTEFFTQGLGQLPP